MMKCQMCGCPIYDHEEYTKFRRKKGSEYFCRECSEETMEYASIGLIIRRTDAELYLHLLDERRKIKREMKSQH